jgi:osmoprotectant transport system permease protein
VRWLEQNLELIAELTLTHLLLTVPAVLASVLLAVPLGWFAHRHRWFGGPMIGAVGVLYAIPSLPLLVLIPAIIGTPLRSPLNLVIVLTVYGVAILARFAADAFAAVPAETLTAATAVGYSAWRRFWAIDVILAAPILFAGLRVVVVSTLSLVTIGSLIGVRSLGTLFTDGFQRGIVAEVVTGIVMTLLLAVILDRVCAILGRALLPWIPATSRRRAAA